MAVGEVTLPSEVPPQPRAKLWTRARITGFALCGFWILAGGSLAYSLIAGLDVETFERYGPRLLNGLWLTVQLVVVSVGLGSLLALPIALARLSGSAIIRGMSFAYVYFFRGTPLLAQVFLLYYGAGQKEVRLLLQDWHLWWFFREAMNCVLLAFTLNTAAYQAEILRVAIRSVPRGQTEAAMSLGLPGWITFLKVILPQALITSLRPLGNEVILMIKGSAIASVVTIYDLMGEARLAYSRTFNMDVYLWAAILYLVIVETLRVVWEKLERRLTRHLRQIQDE